MAVREFGIRDLRNHTQRVLDAVVAGDRVYLTKRNRRIAEIRSVAQSPVSALLEKAAALPVVDTGWADELAAAKQQDSVVQTDRWA